MRARLRAALAWALLALGVCGLCMLSAALPADGYGLRFSEPLSAAQAEALATAAGDRALALTLWRESAVTLTTSRGRSAAATAVWAAGSPGPACPGRYTAGSAPGAGQTDGCAVSAALADALFGSRAVVGLELTVEGQPRRITGVFVSEEPALLCPAAQEDPAAGATAAYLAGVAANDPRGTVQGVLQAAGLGGADPLLLPYGTLRWVLGVAGTLPLLAAGVRLLEGIWRRLPRRPALRWGAGFSLALAAAAALPAVLAALPRWLVPSRWADFDFWGGLAATAAETLQSLFFLPRTVCDAALPGLLLAAGGCLAAAAVGFGLAAGGGIAEVRGQSAGPQPPRAG